LSVKKETKTKARQVFTALPKQLVRVEQEEKKREKEDLDQAATRNRTVRQEVFPILGVKSYLRESEKRTWRKQGDRARVQTAFLSQERTVNGERALNLRALKKPLP